MGGWDPVPWASLVEDRLDFLDRLGDEPAHKPRLEADLDCSRSTIDRAIRRLEDADLVERTPDGYVATPTGRLAAERYRAYLRDQRAIDDARGVLSALDPGSAVPPELVTDATAHAADGDPHRTFERVARRLRTADGYRATLPTLADSRHLRLLHARVVEEGLDADVVVADALADRLREEFPELVADLVDAESCSMRRGEAPAYGLVVATSGDATDVVLATYDAGTLVGTVETEGDAAAERARAVVASAAASAAAVDPPAASGERGTSLSLAGATERALADAGAVRLDRDYFTERTPGDPETAWRLGFDLVDVYYGYAVERTDPSLDEPSADPEELPVPGDSGDTPGRERERLGAGDGRPAVSAVLADRLAAGADHLVLGPAGTGKSTVCRLVACRWVEAGHGPVFYREAAAASDEGLSALSEVVAAADGHALVVVEDAADVTESFLRLVRATRDDPTVTVLGEARRQAWHGAVDDVTDPRLRETAREGFETYRPPAVDEVTCRRAVAGFEAATGRDVPLSPADLCDRVANEGGIGEMYVLSYQVVAHAVAVPWLDDPVGPSVLDGDVRDTYRRLAPGSNSGPGAIDPADPPDATASAGPTGDDTLPLEVGLLVATLAAAELTVTPGLLHAVAAARDAGDDHPNLPHRRVEAVVDDLDGRMLVARDDATAYRTQHPQWATRFLERALDRAERETVDLFERAVNAVLALADDPDRRDRVEAWLGRESAAVRRFDDPDAVDEFVETLFGLGLYQSAFAPLFGTTEHSGIELPDACSTGARLEAASCRGNMWYDYGDVDRAEAELTALVDRAEGADEPARTLYLAEGHWALGELVVDRGETERAQEHLSRALDAARAGDHAKREAGALNSLAWVAMTVDGYDRAEERLQEALDVVAELGVCGAHSDTLYYLARLEQFRGDLAAAEEWLARTVEMDRELGYRGSTSASLKLLADVAKEREAYDRAEEHYRRSLELKREVGDTQGIAHALYEFGDLQLRRDDEEGAEQSFERSLAIARENDMRRHEGQVRDGLGRLALQRGEFDEADRHLQEGRSVHADLDHGRGVAAATASLGDLASERGDADLARERYRESVERYREIGAAREALDVLDRLVDACREVDLDAAVEWCETGVDLATDAGLDEWVETFVDRREALTGRSEN
ncbi:MAG: tetratricopeptide repeat protein [Haloarculaceae archaeon]